VFVDVLHTGLPFVVQWEFAVHSTQEPLVGLHAARLPFLAKHPFVGALESPQATQVCPFPQMGLVAVVHWLLLVHATHFPVPESHVGLVLSLAPHAPDDPVAQDTHKFPWQIGLVGSAHWLLVVQSTHPGAVVTQRFGQVCALGRPQAPPLHVPAAW
jgi:hypothetical protein